MTTEDTNDEHDEPAPDPALGEPRIQSHEDKPTNGQPGTDNAYTKLRHFRKATYDWARIEWKKTSFHERVSISLTLILALSTVVYVFATIVYVGVSIATLRQIKTASTDSGTQMQKMITASENQAAAAKSFSSSAEGINNHTDASVSRLHDLAGATQDAADAAHGTLDESKRQFAVQNRPILWVNSQDTHLLETGGWNWQFINYGKTPALNVHITQGMVFYEAKSHCLVDIGPHPEEHSDFSFPAPMAPNVPEPEDCWFSPGSFLFPNSTDEHPHGPPMTHYRGNVKLKIVFDYDDVFQVHHVTFVCLQNSGIPDSFKPMYCEEPRSCIDTEKKPCRGD